MTEILLKNDEKRKSSIHTFRVTDSVPLCKSPLLTNVEGIFLHDAF